MILEGNQVVFVNLDGIVAIDCHVHLADKKAISVQPERAAQLAHHFKQSGRDVPVDEMASIYRDLNMRAIIMNTTDYTRTGSLGVPNEYIAEAVQRHPDVFSGFGVIDPRLGKAAEIEISRCKELGLIGIGELNPARQGFFPHDRSLHGVWNHCADLQMPVLFHGGYAASGSGTPGGGSVRLRYARPIYLDELAADFPSLNIICAHPSWPWASEALAVAMHKANVFMDISGWGIKYLPDEVVKYMNSRIPHKVLFGTDWPGLDPAMSLQLFRELSLHEKSERQVLFENAVKLFRFDSDS